MAMTPFQLPHSQSEMVTPTSGKTDRVWYQFFANLFQVFGSGNFGAATQVLHGAGTGFSALNLATDVTGQLATANIANAAVTTAKINTNAVTNSLLAQAPALTLKGNNTGALANETDLTVAQVLTMLAAIISQTTGSWTPADGSGAGLAFSSVSANFTQLGNMVFAYATLTYPVTANGSSAVISGLPVTVANTNYAQVPAIVLTTASIGSPTIPGIVPVKATATAGIRDMGTATPIVNSQLSTATLAFMVAYPAT